MPATRSLAAVVRGLVPPGDGPTDADLVGRFAAGRDEAAFALLVRRHGPTVFGVCRRLLRHQQDAEDAFQAVFLVLARKAGSVGRAGAVGSWLYGVAVNVARKARAARLRRREVPWASIVEHRPGGLCHQDSGGTGLPACATQDLAEVIDRELLALPGKYRTAVVLCDLGGRTVREAAAEVGCPAKTLGTRLLRGRALLAARLSRRGVTLSAVGLAAAVPPRLSGSVLPLAIGRADVPPAVAALTHGAVSAMIPKTMAAAAVLAGGLL
ncbi:MAG: sigma-70 family RNA polymerase sigma factor, partial [Gemmataceae bacterium]|nr:sigma-70 family RNA polymerase sigma factor [Gemmataceae bacterium]